MLINIYIYTHTHTHTILCQENKDKGMPQNIKTVIIFDYLCMFGER